MLSIGSTATVRADNITFHIANQSGYGVEVEFYSENFNRPWPGGGKAWIQNDNGTHSYNLSCGPERRSVMVRGLPHTTPPIGELATTGKKFALIAAGSAEVIHDCSVYFSPRLRRLRGTASIETE